MTTTPQGYICKKCDGPSPLGVGYTGAATQEAYLASRDLTTCGCGNSVHATRTERGLANGDIDPDLNR